MTIRRLFVANRGEIAVRIARTATEMGIETVGVFAADDTGSGHVQALDTALPLRGTGPSAYLDGEALVALAAAHQCDAVHPGYGFLSEQAEFAQRCITDGLVFVGPSVAAVTAFGDKAKPENWPMNAVFLCYPEPVFCPLAHLKPLHLRPRVISVPRSSLLGYPTVPKPW